MSAPTHTFISGKEDKHTLTVHYRTEAGELDKITFSSRGEPEGYSLRLVDLGGRRIQKTLTVGMHFAVDGAEAIKVMQVTDAEGVKIKDGVLVTHYIQVGLPAEDAHRLSNQLAYFMHPADYLVDRIMKYKARLDGIAYSDDHIIINHSMYSALKLGLTLEHRFTLTYYAVNFEENVGAVSMTFGFSDEHGERHRVEFYAPEEDIWRMKLELSAFIKAFEAERNPKFEAAATSHIFQQAA